MSEQIETTLSHISKFAPFEDIYGASHFPIYNTGTFDLKKQKGEKIYDYTRSDNPTRETLENLFTYVEKGAGCVCTHTGIAAVSLLFETVLKANASVLVEADCYGGTFRLLKVFKEKYNIQVHFANFCDEDMVEHILKTHNIDLVLCESPTNPGLKIIDLEKIATISHKYNSLFAVDNSLATFISQKPLELGADFSLFSTTKYISGHGSVVAGAIVAKTKELSQQIHYYANALGRSQNPFDVFLISLGIPTLKVRMKEHQENSIEIAKFLEKQEYIIKVTHPALPSHPQYELAKKQMAFIPGVFCVDFKSVELAEKFIEKTKLFGEKCSFGSPDSRVEIPAKISHASFSKEELKAIGISDSTVRFSIGLENVHDLIKDIEQAVR
ncbi:trans-sulfuration enzyme family protein [Aliarcobacter butzleri]|uniref:trans-sulfuration enzyme family protein n=1 Tax=Aliarcobacter butzleri TaxID=28197 RepID=UPI0021B4AD36|nr:PLP-dependent aspartate aminotransferase family protein [Aliarcobacter butzleri]MCT7578550.1 PLP-dependent aspartate aminotransferase family protein [Aliarcobacter butzleri]MCT7584516.1 PLP-dependent aspartate aminotransferase family protein [Aliarcobacter butzleri]MCT7602432.1 PLP-dependent aspartate aminotransferase family protein [Aliarcobacter butzleri]MCT7606548.1 PLP-dependent aspartate aminotransferase family protein [Aliarcobacter butzleri]MCT7608693.1 PLP-dependent aspartate aminot